MVQAEEVPRARLAASGLPVNVEGGEFMTRELLKVGNREVYGADFSWVIGEWLSNQRKPAELMVLERREWGNFYGYLLNVKEAGQLVAEGDTAWGELQRRIDRVDQLHAQISRIEKVEIGRINHGLERLRLKTRKLELDDRLDTAAQADLDAERAQWDAEYRVLEDKLVALQQQFNRDSITVRTADGREQEITLGKVVRAFQPNAMSTPQKLMFYFAKLWEFVSDEPREANTEGGVFPAIFGTVLMTLIMAVIVTPFGVIAAVYLREYAKGPAHPDYPHRGEQPRRGAVDRLWRVRSGLLRLRAGRLAGSAVLSRSRTGAGVRHAGPDVGLADPGHPYPAGGDRRHREAWRASRG